MGGAWRFVVEKELTRGRHLDLRPQASTGTQASLSVRMDDGAAMKVGQL